jgi:hypothetical protein
MKFLTVWAITVCVLLYLAASTIEYKSEKAESKSYTYMVCQGFWPNYKNAELDCDD